MFLAELVILSVTVESRSKSEVAGDYTISRYWVQRLVKRYQLEGEVAFRPRSRRPHGNANALPVEVEDRIIRLRKELSKRGLDAGAQTIRVHVQRDNTAADRRGLDDLADPDPARLRHLGTEQATQAAGMRFCADMPNERWQAEITHWHPWPTAPRWTSSLSKTAIPG